MTTRKAELAALAGAHKAKPATHNAAAARALKSAPALTRTGKPKQKPSESRDRIMVNLPNELTQMVKDAAAAMNISVSTYFVFAVKEKMQRDSEE
jgi:hypothetical protein